MMYASTKMAQNLGTGHGQNLWFSAFLVNSCRCNNICGSYELELQWYNVL